MKAAGTNPSRRRRLRAAPLAAVLALLAGGAMAQQGLVPAQPVQAAPQGPAAVAARVMQLEEELRRMRGRIEELEYEQRRLQGRYDQLLGDVDRRLSAVDGSRAAPAATPAQPGTQPPARATAAAPGSNSLGTLPGNAATPPQQQARVTPVEGAQARYDQALTLLQTGNWQGAEQIFQSFLADYPEDRLAPNASYWLGETYYFSKDYQKAAATFARNYQAYGGEATKAPDNLLKLGMSLNALGDKEKACQTYSELDKRHPGAPAAIKQALVRERAAAGCG
ncbi:tol-pal system protein YbgF [Geminicoccaceae bacterium 1502E]|nr:tol-pal system protein YbgF [Geminicoccaceae bacterium 1502E]